MALVSTRSPEESHALRQLAQKAHDSPIEKVWYDEMQNAYVVKYKDGMQARIRMQDLMTYTDLLKGNNRTSYFESMQPRDFEAARRMGEDVHREMERAFSPPKKITKFDETATSRDDVNWSDAMAYMMEAYSKKSNKALPPPPPPKKPALMGQSILVISGNAQETNELAELMGWDASVYIHVTKYADMLNYRKRSVYIYGTGRERPDFGAIEGLFLRGGHTVVDMDE